MINSIVFVKANVWNAHLLKLIILRIVFKPPFSCMPNTPFFLIYIGLINLRQQGQFCAATNSESSNDDDAYEKIGRQKPTKSAEMQNRIINNRVPKFFCYFSTNHLISLIYLFASSITYCIEIIQNLFLVNYTFLILFISI